jgi:hypothetical protein
VAVDINVNTMPLILKWAMEVVNTLRLSYEKTLPGSEEVQRPSIIVSRILPSQI